MTAGISIDLTDRVAIVTGAARGIGRATAARLKQSGAWVAGCDRHDELDDLGLDLAAVLDVRDAEAVDRFVADVVAARGRIDVLVNNAGGTFVAQFLDTSAKGEAMLLAENFTQVTHLVRRVVPAMTGGGSIVNVTSVEAHQAAPGFAIYAAMKAALANLTGSLALELAPLGIRVNAMAPDALPTDGEHGARDALGQLGIPYRPALLPPIGRFGTPEDGANAIVFLASDLAAMITGSTIHVDGGTRAAGGWQRTT
jgi:NAD(P)-dependent dehydrogenase (short-subunit alcohol dehydrogenase family)